MQGNRRLVLPIVIVALVIAAIWGTIAAMGLRPRLGLDLKGGTSVTFKPISPTGGTPTKQQLSTTVDIIRNRVNSKGVAEAQVTTEGGNIVVAIPDVQNPDEVIKAVGTTAQLRFRPVLNEVSASAPNYKKPPYSQVTCGSSTPPADDPTKQVVLCARDPGQDAPNAGSVKVLLGPVALQGTDVSSADASLDQTNGVTTGGWVTNLKLSSKGASKFEKITGDLACNQGVTRELGITLDGVVINRPPMATSIVCHTGIAGGQAQISGQTEQEAKFLAPLISTGALPLSLRVLTRDTVSATLGNDSLRAGLIAGAVGLALVFVYVLLFYRGLGLVVWVGLACSASINVGLVILFGKLIGFTLSLAGIAGLIVAVGISADSYVVFFERLKDEVREGRTLRAGVDRGWARAFHTLISADTVSFAAALILYWLAIGPVRGFAFTLGVATVIDVFTAWFFTRPAVALLTRTRLFREGRFVGIRAAVQPQAPPAQA